MYDGSSIHRDSDGQSGSDHKLPGNQQLYRSSIQLYTVRDNSDRHHLCMERTCPWQRPYRRCFRHRPEHGERHTEQYDGRRTNSDLQRDTYIWQLHRHSLYGDSDSQSGCSDHSTEHKHMYDGTIQLYADRHYTDGHDLRMGYAVRQQHHRQRRTGVRPKYIV